MCYVNDILSVSLDAISVLKSLQGQFKLKDNKIEPPDVYLGAQLGTLEVKGHHGWFMLSLLEVSMMSSYLAMTRRGHLEQVHHIFGYLKSGPKRKLFFDPQHPSIDEKSLNSYDWYEFYHDIKEVIPEDMPPPRGQSVSTHCFIDADHAGNKVTRRSQTGLLLFVNHAPIAWYSKWQNTIKTSTFSSEFITMKTAVEQIESLCYKLRMFGILIEDPTNVFCDNESVFKNTTIPDSTLKEETYKYLLSLVKRGCHFGDNAGGKGRHSNKLGRHIHQASGRSC